ncbi:hypothetical protein NQ314_011376 [Rhamnusium bicolor]|uniref:PiggyBac transposable element-derived protein domain-containing protein n=1 Tax=Rhamnusium bicolor TaxID=1586634 RepID=A0AAV8XIS1_9CUCU|nr:hypothetical protein NQ314_011376 [Rhamnusium bicolor]
MKVSDERFQWQKENIVPKIHNFVVDNSGCKTENLSGTSTILEVLESFFSRNIMEKITNEINKYYDFVVSQTIPTERSRLKNWKQTNVEELFIFLAVSFLMAQVKKQRIVDYWSRDRIIETPMFHEIMSRDRYLIILRLLHFCDNSNVDKNDHIFKIRSIIDYFRETFRNSMYPFENIVIDESLMLFKGQLSHRQYIPSKRHRFEIKFFKIVDCETGYILDFLIYTGASTEIKEYSNTLGKSGNIVMTLTEPYWGMRHKLFTDNWYTSPALYQTLFDKKMNCCGIVKTNRKNMPPLNEKLDTGEPCFFLQTTYLP